MGDEWTPTTDDVRRSWPSQADPNRYDYDDVLAEEYAEFDRWLRQERARVWKQGHAAGMDDAHPYNASHRNHANPYEED